MDTLTHSLLGCAISDGWFRRRLGPVATPFALLASALPDIDSFTFLLSTESVWANHRGYTHSFLPMAVAAPILGGIGYLLSGRRASWKLWTLLTVLCLFSHTLLDLVTSWGTMPLLPFSNARVSWDIAPIIDVFVLSLTAASFAANRVLRWERVDTFVNPLTFPVVHRHPHRQRIGDWVGRVAAVLVALYLLVGWHQNRQTVRVAREALAKQGITPTDVRAMPIMFTYIAWDIAARDAAGTVYNTVHSSYAPKPMRFLKFPTLPRDEIAHALSTPNGRLFAWYTQDMYVAGRTKEADVSRITLADRRFFSLTNPAAPRFEMTFDEDGAGGITSSRAVQKGFSGMDVGEEFDRLWSLTWEGRGLDGTPESSSETTAAQKVE